MTEAEEDAYVIITQREYDELLQFRGEIVEQRRHAPNDNVNIPTAAPNDESLDSCLKSSLVDTQPPPVIDDKEFSMDWDFGRGGGNDSQDTQDIDEDMTDGSESDSASDSPRQSVSGIPNSDINFGRTTTTLKAPKKLLFDSLCEVLQSRELRQNMCNLQGRRAQVIIDYLYTVLLEPKLPQKWLRRHCLVALYKLSKSSLLYPRCYSIKGSIAFGNSRVTGGSYSDIYKSKLGGTELCLKVVRLPSEGDTSYMLKIYAKEAILWGQLRHPNIVPFYGLFYLDEIRRELCLVSPWMHHGDLGEYLRTHSSPNRASLSYDVVHGVGYLHKLGLIHSDLKAANVLVNNLERALITDFGMSFIRTDKTLADIVVLRGIHRGTIRWSSPELVEEEARATMASDIWALGCVLYQIMTGKGPFASLSTDMKIMRALLSGKKPGEPVSTSDPVGKTILEEVDRCFNTRPEERPNCQEIIDRFQSAGMPWGDERVTLSNALCERRNFLQAMHMESEMSLDIEEVGRVFENLKTDIVQVLRNVLLELLSNILRSKDLRESLENLQGSKAQVVLDYLSSVLLGPALTKSNLRNYCWNSLLRLSHTSVWKPSFHSLKKSISLGAGVATYRNADIHKVTVEGKTLQLIVIHHRLPPDSKKLLKWDELGYRPINHPNIVPFYGVYSIGDQEALCFAFPWMSHGTISQYVKSFTDAPRAPLIYDVASGLEHQQSRHSSIGYLTGATIFINDLHRACIFPFWTSHWVEDPFDLAVGDALRYMAPEHMLSDSDSSNTGDIWAFGCVCYNILTGNRPFHSITATGRQLYRRLIDEHRAGHKPGEVPGTFSDPIEKVIWMEVDRCWSTNPSDRPTAQEILRNLESAGISRGNEGFNKDDAECEKQYMRDLLGDAEPVDLKAVQRVFEELKQVKE